MFLIEMIKNWYDSKLQEYDRDMKKWINEGLRSNGSFSYRDENTYRMRFGAPFEKTKKIVRTIICIIGIIGLMTLFFLGVIASSQAEAEERKTAYVGHNCKAHDLNDHVKVDYGTWAGATGTIVGGCDHDKEYQVKLDNQMYNVDSDGNSDPVQVEGKIIAVDTYKNLIKIEKESNESK